MWWLTALQWSAAVVALVASPWLLSRAWRRGPRARVERIGGWLALLVSMGLFAMVAGPMRGIAFALIGLPLPALALAWMLRERQPVEPRPRQRAAIADTPPRSRWLRAAARVVLALPLALAAAMSVAIWLSYLAGHLTSGVITALAVALLLWAVAAWWALADPKLWRPAIGLALCVVVGGPPLWLL